MSKHLEFSATGERLLNEDYILIKDLPENGLYAAVADGVGGNSRGDYASKFTAEFVFQAMSSDAISLEACISKAHDELIGISSDNLEMVGMATTLTCIVIKNNQLIGAHVGDTRLYILRNDGIVQLSHDQTEIKRMIDEGTLSKEQARFHPHNNILTSAVGSNKNLSIQNIPFIQLLERDRVLLMSDGAYSSLTKRRIRDISKEQPMFEDFFETLVGEIASTKPLDNFSIVAIEV